MSNPENIKPEKTNLTTIAIFGALILAAVAMRVWGNIPNFQPVAGLALFAGFLFPKTRWAVAGILLLMFASDYLIDWLKYDVFTENYPWQLMLTVYGCFLLPILFGSFLRRWRERMLPLATGVIGCSIVCSVLFFLITNWACWQWQVVSIYPKTLAGLGECMAAGLPFVRATIVGDLIFSLILFGGWYAIKELGLASTRQSVVSDQ